MKGLVLKDLYLLQANRRFLILYIVLTIVLCFTDPSFAVLYQFILTANLCARTINYDEQNHGWLFLFSLPISRKEYVLEKYLLSLSVSALLSVILGVILLFLDQITLPSMLTALLSGWISASILMAVYFPMEIRYGPERSSLAMLMLFVAIIAAIWLTDSFTGLGFIITGLSGIDEGLFIGLLVGISVLLLVISYLFSCRFLRKKQF